MIQTELEEAGFDLAPIRKMNSGVVGSELLRDEMSRWHQNYVDVNGLVKKLLEAERANRRLREEVRLKLCCSSNLKTFRVAFVGYIHMYDLVLYICR